MSAPGRQITSSAIAFAHSLTAMPEQDLVRKWQHPSEPGTAWSGYEDSPREVVFNAYQQLRDLAVEIETSRQPPSEAQRILAQHQLAYRDLTGALAGVGDAEFDLSPAENEWPLRTVIYHVGLTERGFHALIHWAVARRRGGDVVSIEMPAEHRDAVSDPIVEDGTLAEVLGRLNALHIRALTDFVDLDAADLDAPNIWWEGYEVPVRFRMHRFDAHLREHTIQVDKTLAGIGHPPTEPERLARLIHRALGQVEGALLGAPDAALDLQQSTAAEIDAITARLR